MKKLLLYAGWIATFSLIAILLFFAFRAAPQAEPSMPPTESTTEAPTEPLTGWQLQNGQRRYLDDSGTPVSGWITWMGQQYYLQENGTPAQGWLHTPEGSFYLNAEGRPITGWYFLDGAYYYFSAEGTLCTGWTQIADARYYFSQSGKLHTGWLVLDGQKYFLDERGIAVSGWQTIGKQRYCFDETGLLLTGWYTEGEYRYYLLPGGTPATGKQEIDGKTYFFSPQGIEVLLTNKSHPLGSDYAPELVEVEDGFRVDAACLPALQAMLKAMRDQGLYPLLSSAYRSLGDQTYIYQRYVNQYTAAGYSSAQAKAMTEKYVAPPGTSEHHTGLAVDIVGWDYFYGTRTGSTRAVQAWLAEHCWEYGFILRYTEEKKAITGFAAETWHFRYVGVEVAMDIKPTGLCLEEYLGAV